MRASTGLAAPEGSLGPELVAVALLAGSAIALTVTRLVVRRDRTSAAVHGMHRSGVGPAQGPGTARPHRATAARYAPPPPAAYRMHGESELSWRIRRLAVSGEVAAGEGPLPARRASTPLLDRGVRSPAAPRPLPDLPRHAVPPGAPVRRRRWPLPRRLTAVLAATWLLSIGGLIAIKPALEGEVLDATSGPTGGISALSRTPIPPTNGPAPGGMATATDPASPPSDLAGTDEPNASPSAVAPGAQPAPSAVHEPSPVGPSGPGPGGSTTEGGSAPVPPRTGTPRPGAASPGAPAPTTPPAPAASAGSNGGASPPGATPAPTAGATPAPSTTSMPTPTPTPTPTAAPTPSPTPDGGKPLVAFDSTVDGLSVRFHNRTRGAVSWTWSFGDGTTSTLRNPTHVYGTPGRYVVSLTAIGDDGTSATATQAVVVGG